MVFDDKDIEAVADKRASRAEHDKVSRAFYVAVGLMVIGYLIDGYTHTGGVVAVCIGVVIILYYLYLYLPTKQKALRFEMLQEWHKEQDKK